MSRYLVHFLHLFFYLFARRSFSLSSSLAFIFSSLVSCSHLFSSFLHAGLSLRLSPPAFIFPSLVPCSLLVSSFWHAGPSLYLQHRRSFSPALFPVLASFPLFCTPVFLSVSLLRRSFSPALFPVSVSFPLFCTPVFLSISISGVHFLPPCPLLPSRFLFFARRSFSLSPTPAFIFPSLVSSSRLFSSFLHAGLSLYLHLRRSVSPTLFPVPTSFPLFCTPVFFSISISGVHFSPPCFLFTPRFLFFARRLVSLSPPPAFSFSRLIPCSRLFSSFLHAGLSLYLPPPAFIFPSLVPCSRLVSSLLHAGLSLYLQHRRSFFPALSPVPASFPLFCTPACQQPLPFQSLYLPFALVSSTRYFSTSSACSA